MIGMMSQKTTIIMKTITGMTDTLRIITRIDVMRVEIGAAMIGTDHVLHMKKGNVTATLRVPPPGVGAP